MSSHASKQLPQDDLIGRVINDRFRIISVVARGGMGRVYRAEQVPLGRLVAIKTLDPRNVGGENDPQFQQRFFLEASIASKLQHPNTVTVFDYGRTADGIYFIAMELVEGRSLLSLIRQEAPLPAARVVHIALQIARSLREAHRLDVIHRDLKPGNVLLTRHGDEEDFVKVLDFGLVKHIETAAEQELTKAGLFMGSPKYMSPEQIRGERVDARADIYALGVVMYEMLTGRVPFDRENTVKVLMAHMHEAPPPIQHPDCPPALNDLVMRCLSKAPEGRPSSMDEVILLLKQASGGNTHVSGAFPLSGELRLSGTPGMMTHPPSGGRLVATTPSQPFVSGTHPMLATPSSGFSASLHPGSVSQTFHGPLHSGSQPAAAPVARPSAFATWLPRLAVAGALAIAAGFLYLRFREQNAVAVQPAAVEPKPVATSAAASSTTAVTATNEPTTPEPPPRHVFVRLTSNPPGAKVEVGGKTYGPTPADIELWGELAEKGKEVTFVFKKDGFQTVPVTRVMQAEKLNVDAVLPRLYQPPPKRRVETREREHRIGPVVTPDNFKEDPY